MQIQIIFNRDPHNDQLVMLCFAHQAERAFLESNGFQFFNQIDQNVFSYGRANINPEAYLQIRAAFLANSDFGDRPNDFPINIATIRAREQQERENDDLHGFQDGNLPPVLAPQGAINLNTLLYAPAAAPMAEDMAAEEHSVTEFEDDDNNLFEDGPSSSP